MQKDQKPQEISCMTDVHPYWDSVKSILSLPHDGQVKRLVTPDLARLIMNLNESPTWTNRYVRSRHVSSLAASMRMGEWVDNGDSIGIAKNGRLLDGQHRLLAVMQSGVTVTLRITTGLDPDVFSAIDTDALPRQRADVVSQLNNPKHATQLASCVPLIYWYQIEGKYNGSVRLSSKGFQRLYLYYSNRGLCTIVEESRKWVKSRRIMPRVLGALHYLFSDCATQTESYRFLDAIDSGENCGANEWMLRESLIKNATSNRRLGDEYVMAVVIKTWNAVQEGRGLKLIRWSPGGSEGYPQIHGKPEHWNTVRYITQGDEPGVKP